MALIIKEEKETEAKMVQTRNQLQIIDGELVGSEIVLERDFYRVWTGRIGLARRYAKDNGWKIRELDGECELWIPVSDAAIPILKKFGAKVKRTLSPEALAGAMQRLSKINSKSKKMPQEGTSGNLSAKGEG